MARIDPVDYESAHRRSKELLDALKAALGATPNMTTTMARSAVLEGWLGLTGARRFESSNPTSAAVVTFAHAVAVSRGGFSEGDIDPAHRAGLTDEQLSDIVGHVAVNVLTNYFNRAFDVDVDFPTVHPHARQSAA
jgi:alkylhydroperoxidase family enzyme